MYKTLSFFNVEIVGFIRILKLKNQKQVTCICIPREGNFEIKLYEKQMDFSKFKGTMPIIYK